MKNKLIIGMLFIGLVFTACQQGNPVGIDKNTKIELTQGQIDQISLMKEVSLAVGNTLKDKKAKSYLVDLVKLKNDDSETISLAALLGDDSNVSNYEQKLLNRGSIISNRNSGFKDYYAKQFFKIIVDNPSLYPLISKNLINKNIQAKGTDNLNALRKELATKNLEIYLPYQEEYNWDNVTQVTTTWHPLVREDWNEGNLIDIANIASKTAQVGVVHVNVVNDTYAATNPTIIIKPKDPYGDIGGGILNPVGSGGGTGGGGTGGFQPTTRWVTTNLDYTVITEKDVLSTFIPKIRLTSNYRGLFGGSNKITIYRSSGGLKLDPTTGFVVPEGTALPLELLTEFKISRHSGRRKLWKTVNIIWDDDWDKHENTEAFVLVTKEAIFKGSVLNIAGKVKIGYDVAKQKATFTPTATANFNITTAHRSKLRYNNELSRRGVLSNVVGDNGAGTINDNGVNYTIRTADKLQYYFKHKWTHVQ